MDETLYNLIESLEKDKLLLAKKRVIEDIKLENKYNLLKEELKEISKKGLPYKVYENHLLQHIIAATELHLIEYSSIKIDIGIETMKQLIQDKNKMTNYNYNIMTIKNLKPILVNKLHELEHENNIVMYLEYNKNDALLIIRDFDSNILFTEKSFFLHSPYKNMKIIL